jgi:DNA-damage-inducible protein J
MQSWIAVGVQIRHASACVEVGGAAIGFSGCGRLLPADVLIGEAQEDKIRGMPTKDSYVRARVDSKLKRDSERILERLGLSTTEAIRLFLVQVRLQKGLPFHVGLNPSKHADDDILLPCQQRFKSGHIHRFRIGHFRQFGRDQSFSSPLLKPA